MKAQITKITWAVILGMAFMFTACTSQKEEQKRLLASELNGYELTLVTLTNDLNTESTQLNALEREKQSLESELASLDRNMNAYLMNHKMATAAIALGMAGADMTLDNRGRYSQDARDVAGIVTFGVAVYAAFNFDEIMEVFDQITQATDRSSRLERRIARLDNDLVVKRRTVGSLRTQVKSLNGKMLATRAAIRKLNS